MKFEHVALGGTFDLFHKGHERLLEKGAELGGHLTIGITSDKFAEKSVERYENRVRAVKDFLDRIGVTDYIVTRLEEPFGPAAYDPTMEAIVVSEETYERALELNRIRVEKGLGELEIIRIPMVLAWDGRTISSSRIRSGCIDRDGSSA